MDPIDAELHALCASHAVLFTTEQVAALRQLLVYLREMNCCLSDFDDSYPPHCHQTLQ